METLKLVDADYGALARMLRGVDFFAPLTVGQLEKVLPYVLLVSFGAGEAVFRQGEAGDAFYIVYTGRIEIRSRKGFFSFPKTLGVLGPGAFLGEMALLERRARAATARAVEPSKLFVLTSADFEKFLGMNPAFAEAVKSVASRRRFDTAHGP